MADYVVGDIQGCYNALSRVLEKARFDPVKDTLWCVGDLVNRGGQSTQTMSLLYSIKGSVKSVLGNHDLYLLKAYGGSKRISNPEFQEILKHQDAAKWCEWLASCPLCIHEKERDFIVVHAGIPHFWSFEQAELYSQEASREIVKKNNHKFWDKLFGNRPGKWRDGRTGFKRTRVILNVFTRMRYVSKSGRLNLKRTDKPTKNSKRKYQPWYGYSRRTDKKATIYFGHWASLHGKLYGMPMVNAVAMDTGCVWGGKLTLKDMDSGEIFTAKQKN